MHVEKLHVLFVFEELGVKVNIIEVKLIIFICNLICTFKNKQTKTYFQQKRIYKINSAELCFVWVDSSRPIKSE